MHYEHHVEVAAPPEVVWGILSDVERWPEWTPTMKSVRLIEGDSIAVGTAARIQQPAQPAATWRVTQVDAGRSFTWGTRNLGMTMVGTHVIEPIAIGSRVTLGIDISGLSAAILMPLIQGQIRKAVAIEAQGLKGRAEAEAGARA